MPTLAAPPIEDLAALKKLEQQVKVVAAKTMPATVSLISPNQNGSGSGVIVSEGGLILTAAHVVDGFKKMIVVFPDGTQEWGTVLGSNYSRDASMVQLDKAGPWPFAEVGDSSNLVVGDFVVALGHPKGFDPTRKPPVRFGRIMTRSGSGFLTTDCTLIGGDSGGPLFDTSGKVIGIHSHISPREYAVNNHAEISGFKRSWDKMKAGRVWGLLGADRRADLNRPVLGVVISHGPGGTMIVDDTAINSSARNVGIKPGDQLLKLNGLSIRDDLHMQETLMDFEPGDEIKVVVKRGEEELEKTLELHSARQLYRRRRR